MPILLYGRQVAAAGLPPPPDPAYCAESNLHQIIGTVGAMNASSTIIVLLRVLVRIFMTKSFGSDDYCMLAAWTLSLATFVCWIGERPYAIGKHFACVTPHDLNKHAQWQYFHSLFVMWGVILVKVSIALFLMRLVPPGKRWKHFLWGSIVFLICFLIACSGTLIWQCVPVQAAWDFSVRSRPGTKCFSNSTFSAIGLFNSSVNCITDFLFAILPIPVIMKLQVNTRTKITLAVILSLGYFACAAGIIKAVKQYHFFAESDPFWYNSFNVWNYIELCVGIMAGSLPALKPLFATLLSTTKSLVAQYSPNNSNGRTVDTSDSTSHDKDDDISQKEDIQLESWGEAVKSSRLSHVRSASQGGRGQPASHSIVSSAENAYSVRVRTGGHPQRVSEEDEEWETIGIPRNESNERLHIPHEIHKEVEIYSTTQRRS